MMPKKGTLALMAVLIVQLTAKMIVQSPSELASYFSDKYPDGSIPYSIANYGVIPYGKVVSGQIGTPQFLQDCIYEEIPENARKNIVIVERADCTFTQKSINVQKEGGKLAVIIDNVVQNSQEVVMKDDGKGHFVTIPTVLIGKQDGYKILEYISQHPIISVAFELVEKEKSDVTLWIDVLDHKNYIFLREFQSYFNRIQADINFQVAYPTSRCSDGCIDSNCFYGGKYCRNPHGFWGVENGGQEIIKEQLRQYHVFQASPSKWWDYMLKFDDRCDDLAVFEECSNKILSEIGIQSSVIAANVEKSFTEEDNHILSDFSAQKYDSNIIYYPSIVINSIIYRGNLEPTEVFQVICDSMTPSPSGCSEDSQQSSTHLANWIMFGVVSVILFVIFLIVCFRRIARRQLSKEMNKKVNELVNEYISMYEVEKFKQGESQLKNRR